MSSWEVLVVTGTIILYLLFVFYVAEVKKRRLKNLRPIKKKPVPVIKTASKKRESKEDAASEAADTRPPEDERPRRRKANEER